MSYSTQHAFRPVEASVDLSRIQFADYPNRDVQVADYTQVNYLQPSDSEEESEDDEDMNTEDVERRSTLYSCPSVARLMIVMCTKDSYRRSWP